MSYLPGCGKFLKVYQPAIVDQPGICCLKALKVNEPAVVDQLDICQGFQKGNQLRLLNDP